MNVANGCSNVLNLPLSTDSDEKYFKNVDCVMTFVFLSTVRMSDGLVIEQ